MDIISVCSLIKKSIPTWYMMWNKAVSVQDSQSEYC